MNNNDKILITTPNLQGHGGVASYYGAVLPHLSNNDFSVVTLEVGSWGKERNLLQPLHDQLSFRHICQTIPRLVHINPSLGSKSFWRDGLFAWQAKRKGCPLLVFFHGWDQDFAHTVEKKYLPFFNKTFSKADCIIVLASEFKEKLRQWGVKCPIFVETTTVDEQLLESFDYKKKHASPLNKDKASILFLSRLEEEKGVFETIDAIKILVQNGLEVCLAIAGDGRSKNKAEEYVRQLDLVDHVSFLGYVRNNDKVEAYSNHDIYCFPTHHGEGLPISVLEAMAFGMPVVTTPAGGLRDMFQDPRMGLFTKPTPNDIADKLEKLITQPDLMRQISQFNHLFAQKNLMASKVAKRLTKTYKQIIEQHGHN